ncbi:hypothetical protein D3C75_635010 [compost metagenome]
MLNGLNLKEIAKQIKASGKSGSVIWSREENQHFISNRHFLLRVEEVPSELLIALFTIFLKVPALGETLNCNFGQIQDNQKPLNFDKIYNPDKQSQKGTVTPFIKESGEKLQMRVIQFPDHFSYINEQFMRMTSDKYPISTSSPMMPVYFAENNLVLLPYRVVSTPEDDTLTRVLGETIE